MHHPDSVGRDIQPAMQWDRKRFIGSAVFLFMVSIIAIDAAPTGLPILNQVQWGLSCVLNRIGLWQGEWSMFAPDPVVTNGWLSAELTYPDGERRTWTSRSWNRASGVEKFVDFRHLNYVNRIDSPWNKRAVDDLADYLARTLDRERDTQPIGLDAARQSLNEPSVRTAASSKSRLIRIQLFKCSNQPIVDPENPFPDPDNTAWMIVSTPLVTREVTHEQ